MLLIKILINAYVFLLGACVGSFLNVCVYRIPLGIPISRGRSFCPACHGQLRSRDLIPVVSFLLLRGRCRFCKAPISPRYPTVELAGGMLFLLSLNTIGLTLKAAAAALFFCVLLTVALIDWDTGEIPDRLHICIVLLAPIYALSAPALPLWEHLLGAVVLSLPMLLGACLLGGFGGGDVKLTAACGLLLGWRLTLLGGLFAVITAAVYGLILLARNKARRDSAIPFGPFLSGGMVLACCFGERLISAYLALLR